MQQTNNYDAKVAAEDTPPRDPEDRPIPQEDERARRDKNLDKTVADSFPTSDPPSTIPDPAGDV